MTLPFKPMLSADVSDVDLSTLRYPLIVSPKLDGIRCIVWEGVAYSRNAKPIRNRFVQKWAANHHNLDGELIVGSPTDPHCLNNTQSGVMSYDGEPDFQFYLFDAPQRVALDFETGLLHVTCEHVGQERIIAVEHRSVHCVDTLLEHERNWLAEGYEGMMLRAFDGPYKHGRSTLREGYLMKLKRFMDGEAVVVRLEEGHKNANELQRDELGRAKRTTHQENLVPSGMVGTIIALDPKWGEIRVSPGTMTHHDRQLHWLTHGAHIVGKAIHWRSFGYGVKDMPRFPRYYGIREDV